ncbi:hypothetical protein EYF80_068188 [Liparis tanakae]|uniref:Uncharacterized protein n=1 Tax=Liparis tanakae TaxID=230148 RepID=A0A4Z2DZM5_9TELE|nr:hypothetical protein EYF80_068188 [Liparis tanakae]
MCRTRCPSRGTDSCSRTLGNEDESKRASSPPCLNMFRISGSLLSVLEYDNEGGGRLKRPPQRSDVAARYVCAEATPQKNPEAKRPVDLKCTNSSEIRGRRACKDVDAGDFQNPAESESPQYVYG